MKVKELKLDNDLKQNLFIDKSGVVVTGTYKAIMKEYTIKGLSWSKMHELYIKKEDGGLTRSENDFFKHIGVKPTVFDVANLRHFGLFHVYPLILAKSNLLETELKEVQ